MSTFTHKELEILQENYRLTMQTNPATLSIQTVDLLNEQQLYSYLTQVKEKTKTANLAVAASLFVKRYSFAVLIALYSMSVLNKRIDFSFENVSIETIDETNTLWIPSFKFYSLTLGETVDSSRLKWRDEILRQVFGNHMDVLFSQLYKKCKLSKLIMWENLYIYIQWMYKNLLDDPQYSHHHATIADDLHYILKEGKAPLFGSYQQNPFLKCCHPKQRLEKYDGVNHRRKTCCLSYLVGSKRTYCSICPIVCGVNKHK